eukprot:1160919-Pelagomonas_calceolata.AAC.9
MHWPESKGLRAGKRMDLCVSEGSECLAWSASAAALCDCPGTPSQELLAAMCTCQVETCDECLVRPNQPLNRSITLIRLALQHGCRPGTWKRQAQREVGIGPGAWQAGTSELSYCKPYLLAVQHLPIIDGLTVHIKQCLIVREPPLHARGLSAGIDASFVFFRAKTSGSRCETAQYREDAEKAALGGSAAHALLNGKCGVASELDLGVGWQERHRLVSCLCAVERAPYGWTASL